MHSSSQFSEIFLKNLLPFVFGKKDVLRLFEIALLIKGHILIEDLPGVGKTTFSKAFATVLGKKFSRIQGTSDLLPSDILGGEVVNLQTKELSLKKGPIFSDIVLIDEINRMHPKTQSAFLEAMEEKTVSLVGEKYPLPSHHMIIATQNPVEHEGTNVLPEAQRDRFACKVSLGFPPKKIQMHMLQNTVGNIDSIIQTISSGISDDMLEDLQSKVQSIHMDDIIATRIVDFCSWTREDIQFRYGVSPRGMMIFGNAMRANAFLERRDFVLPEDGIHILSSFLLHRIEFREEKIENEKESILRKKFIEIFS